MKLGTSTEIIEYVRPDQSGDKSIELLKQRGVEITAVQHYSQAPIASSLCDSSGLGECHFAGFGRISRNKLAESQLDAQEIQESLFVTADCLVMGRLGLAYPSSWKAMY